MVFRADTCPRWKQLHSVAYRLQFGALCLSTSKHNQFMSHQGLHQNFLSATYPTPPRGYCFLPHPLWSMALRREKKKKMEMKKAKNDSPMGAAIALPEVWKGTGKIIKIVLLYQPVT